MRKLGVFTALALSGMTAACAERLASPAVIPKPAPTQRTEVKPRSNVELRSQAKKLTENTGKQLAVRDKGILPSTSNAPKQRADRQAPLPQASDKPPGTSIGRDPPSVAAGPARPDPAEIDLPVAALMPPPPEPAEPTFPSVPPAIRSPSPDIRPESAMPPPPEPAEPSFPVAALMPPEAAEPSLPSQEGATEELISIPLPEPPSYLSLRPRFDWVDAVGAIQDPRGPRSEAPQTSPETSIPSLVQDPWPLPTDAL